MKDILIYPYLLDATFSPNAMHMNTRFYIDDRGRNIFNTQGCTFPIIMLYPIPYFLSSLEVSRSSSLQKRPSEESVNCLGVSREAIQKKQEQISVQTTALINCLVKDNCSTWSWCSSSCSSISLTKHQKQKIMQDLKSS